MLIRSLNKANYLLQKQSTSQGAAAAFGFVWGLLFGFFNVSGINNICLACSMYVVFCKKKVLFGLAIYQESKATVFCYAALLSGYEHTFIVLYLQSLCMS